MTKTDENIKNGRLKKAAQSPEMIRKELSIAKRDLSTAQISLDMENYKWATIQSYYAIFHAMRSLLFSVGLREESHTALKQAIHDLFVLTGQLSETTLQALERGMDLREMADYKETYSADGARRLYERVQVGINETEALLASTEKLWTEGKRE